jgi:hypothetical protein
MAADTKKGLGALGRMGEVIGEEGSRPVIAQLKITNRLLAILVTKSVDAKQAISVLSSAGLQPSEISAALGTTPNAVRIALHRLRKAAGAVPDHQLATEQVADSSNPV